ncbi:unnamed protein product (macronuclear) [Paramecium tetraurelia]|uniref:Transmembrane protein n=1 Tax=Paramecium tetraurelia TaxID=5888 RepID=A0CV28_PARTE|nr:uncharacterized protein GSPATT00010813001 [Paramecium tetraurelia]CAK74645.1 unnamed protein product [Paramecium tetraurelia]|eukprot:XP_001442042.1 hypothetical protein (macronuclear) [Paramecium tetraurelia strain d4-2]
MTHYTIHDEFSEQILQIFIAILTFIFIICFQITLQIVCLKSFDLKLTSFNQIYVSFLDYVLQLLYIIQFISYSIVNNLKNALIIQSILIIIISAIKILRVFELHTCKSVEQQIILVFSCFGLQLGFNTLILYLLDEYERFINVLTLILFLLFYQVINQEFKSFETTQLLKFVKQNKISFIKYLFGKIINLQFNKTQYYLINSLIYQHYGYMNYNGGNTREHIFETLDPDVELKFNSKQLSILSKLIQEDKNFDIQYVSILFQLKFYNLAYKQIMIANSQSQGKRLNYSSDIYIKDSEVSRMQTFNNKAKESIRSMSKSGKSNSEDLNNIIQKKILKKNKLLISIKDKIPMITQAQLNYLKQMIRQDIKLHMLMVNNKKYKFTEIQLGVEMFLKNEKRNNNLRYSILQLLQEKVQFYTQFVNKKILNHQKLFESAKKISGQMHKIEQKLNRRYDQYPSHKIQSMLIYFQAELQNNFIEAYRIKNLTSISEQQLIDIEQNLQISLFSKEVVYMSAAQLEDQGEILVLNCSENTQKFFDFSNEQQKEFTTISYILPDFILNEHNILVNNFIQTGEAKYYLSYSQSFYKSANNFVKCCDLLFDIHFDEYYLFRYSIFLQNTATTQSYIFVDVNEQLGGFTETVFEKLKYSNTFIDEFSDFNLKILSIDFIFPEFPMIIKHKKNSISTELRFLKQDVFSQYLQQSDHKISLQGLWNDSKNLNLYMVDLRIQFHNIWDFNYYIIELGDCRPQNQLNMISLPVFKSQNDIENMFQLSQLTESEAPALNAKEFQKKLNKFNIIEQIQQEEILLASKMPAVYIQHIPQSDFEPNILSPNSSQIGLNEISYSKQPQLQQQDYFNQSIRDNSYSMQKSIQQIQHQNILPIDQKEDFYEQQYKKNTTLTSKQTGIQRSMFYKKYELVHDSLFSQTPPSMNKLLLLILVSLLICLIFYIIVLALVSQDLTRFIAEIDMIQLHSGVMVPHDFYFQMRFAIFTYTGFLNKKVITKDRFNNLTDLFYNNMHIGYNEFKNGFTEQLNNQYLQPFYNDKNVTVYYMYEFGLNTYPVTYNVREVFFTFLTYYYEFLLRFQARLTPANQTYQVFQFANAFKLHNLLEDLAQDAWAYSKQRSIVIKDKWNQIWMIFLIFSFLPVGLAIYYMKLYRQLQDKYLNLFRYFSNIKVQREIEKTKTLIKQLKQNPDRLYHYKFEVEQFEEQIVYEKGIIEKEQQKYKESKYLPQFKQLSITYSVIILLGVWMLFFLFSFFSNQQVQQYLDKYPNSCDLYKFLQNMSLSTGSLPRNREFKLTFPSLPYIREEDNLLFYETIRDSLNDISSFLKLCLNFDPDLYYSSEGFSDYFNTVQEQNVCDVLGDEQVGFLSYYCDISFNGNLKLGLLPTIKYLYNEILQEQSINNFTQRVEYIFFDMEGGLIITRAFQYMSKIFKNGMVTITQEQINISNVEYITLLQALSICYIILNILLIVYFSGILPIIMIKELNQVRRFVLIVPRTVLLLDDQFERHARMIGVNEKY